MTVGEAFRWKIFRAADGRVYDADADYAGISGIVTHAGFFAPNGISQLVSLVAGTATQCLTLRAGWSLISAYVVPQHARLDSVFNPVLSDVIIVKNGAQQSFIPSVPVNGIGAWNNAEGYQLKLANARSLCITGQKILPSQASIDLPMGWSIAPYLRDADMPIVGAMSGIVDDLILVKDQDGRSYVPSAGVNGIGDMNVGQAYQVKMATARSLVYPDRAPAVAAASMPGPSVPTPRTRVDPPWFVLRTGTSHIVIIPLSAVPTLDGRAIEAGDHIGAFYDSCGTPACAGYAVWTGTGPITVPVFGDDPTTATKDGLQVGDLLQWKIRRQGGLQSFTAHATYAPVGGMGGAVSDSSAFADNGISGILRLDGSVTNVERGDVPAAFALLQNYPNPFNPSTRIGYQLPTGARVQISVLNTLGQTVAVLVDGSRGPGYHECSFDASGLASGVYVYRIVAGTFVGTRTMVLIR
jgi:hypothetical protein